MATPRGWRTRKQVLVWTLVYCAVLFAVLAVVGSDALRQQIVQVLGTYATVVTAAYTGAKTFFNVSGGYGSYGNSTATVELGAHELAQQPVDPADLGAGGVFRG